MLVKMFMMLGIKKKLIFVFHLMFVKINSMFNNVSITIGCLLLELFSSSARKMIWKTSSHANNATDDCRNVVNELTVILCQQI